MSLTPAHGTPSPAMLEIMEMANALTIRVDRLVQSNKILKWVAVTAAAFAFGSSLTIAKMLYGWGRDDESLRADVRSMGRDIVDLRAEQRELRNLVYSRTTHP
jgi:hypothetical protein